MTDERQPFRVLTVCLGNICRSPLVEQLLRLRLERAGLGAAYDVRSAGLVAREGLEMQWDAAGELKALGGDPTAFRSRPFTGSMAQEADLVLTATADIRRRLLQEAPAALRRTFTVREFARLATTADLASLGSPADLVRDAGRRRGSVAGLNIDVPDPMNQSAAVHSSSARLSAEAVDAIAAALIAVDGRLPSRGGRLPPASP